MASNLAVPDTTPGDSPQGSRPLTAADLTMGMDSFPTCTTDARLADMAEILALTGQDAAVVVDSEGLPRHLLTEDDVLQAYLVGAPADCTVGEWLRGLGTTPSFDASSSSVDTTTFPASPPLRGGYADIALLPETPLAEVVPRLAEAVAFGRSHLVVPRTAPDIGGILSPLTLTRALADQGLENLAEGLGMPFAATVADLMEPLPVSEPSSTMQQIMQAIMATPSRATLIAEAGVAHGLATAADALWAFRERISPTEVAWQRVSSRPGRTSLESHFIASDLPLETALNTMSTSRINSAMTTATGTEHTTSTLRCLVAVQPGSSEPAGLFAPANLALRAAVPTRQAGALLPSQTLPGAAAQDLAAGHAQAAATPVSHGVKKHHKIKEKKRHGRRTRNISVLRHPRTLAELAADRDTPLCSESDSLMNACDALVSSGRTAIVVMSEEGSIRGVLTENDVLTALLLGVSWHCTVKDWLRGGVARLPGFMLPMLTLSHNASLSDAAMHMTLQASTEGEDIFKDGQACHHVLVQMVDPLLSPEESPPESNRDSKRERFLLLSALDIARGMLESDAAHNAGAPAPCFDRASAAVAALSVQDVMKPRAFVPTCTLDDSLKDAFCKMNDYHQNCALVVALGRDMDDDAEDELDVEPAAMEAEQTETQGAEDVELRAAEQDEMMHAPVRGIITGSDVLRAFSECVEGSDTQLRGWLRGLHACLAEHPERVIAADASLAEAASRLGKSHVHHLIVVKPTPIEPLETVGVISALDIVRAIGNLYMEESDRAMEVLEHEPVGVHEKPDQAMGMVPGEGELIDVKDEDEGEYMDVKEEGEDEASQTA
eukprot:TRINITY_DN15207_c0_g1_i1.p1 TRINITY_DN15207_c0_g1~~TRINITY_DN15207_c0_g1_i1.p1  ORF type:complete len:834 (-),score=168.80 TRINITY_DN15207_c0_g1_i1:57-2558(-)